MKWQECLENRQHAGEFNRKIAQVAEISWGVEVEQN